ncbi:MAG: FkbM family methyltransferase [Magnetococcales bacterium]|nr:FkbM family methyltransferase [Magnetococcales bacterium]
MIRSGMKKRVRYGSINRIVNGLRRYLLSRNFDSTLIKAYTTTNGHPTVVLQDDTRLTGFWDSGLTGPLPGIASGYESLVYDALLRYRFAHGLPWLQMDFGLLPGRLAAQATHPQHVNTLHGLSYAVGKAFRNHLTINPGDTVLEAGAFLGFGTIRLSRLVGASGRVVSMELSDTVWPLLGLNCTENRLNNVNLVQKALGDESGTATAWMQGRQVNTLRSGLFTADSSEKKRAVEVVTLEQLCRTQRITPRVIILTINGMELSVLRQSKAFLSELKACALMVPGWYRDETGKAAWLAIEALLKGLGFITAVTSGGMVFAYKGC